MAPLVVALHRAAESDEMLLEFLRKSAAVPVTEALDKEPLLPGCVYLAPADYHLLIEEDRLALSVDPPVCWARPSIDVLFESAADSWGEQAIGVILSGGNADGAAGLARIKEYGGLAVVQEPSEAECAIMPEASLRAVQVDKTLRLEEIAVLLSGIRAPQLR